MAAFVVHAAMERRRNEVQRVADEAIRDGSKQIDKLLLVG